jgi:hypothetical protein
VLGAAGRAAGRVGCTARTAGSCIGGGASRGGSCIRGSRGFRTGACNQLEL